jgi:hypothetical protein
MFRSIHAERLDHKSIQGFEIDFSDGGICTGSNRIDEMLQRFLGDDDLLNCRKPD